MPIGGQFDAAFDLRPRPQAQETTDDELREWLDATHRGFWGAYTEAFPRILRDLARARGIDIEAVNRAADHRLRTGLDLSPEAVLRALGEDYR